MTAYRAKAKPLGRHNLEGAREPAVGYASLPASLHNSRTSIAIVAVKDAGHDPTGKARSRVLARLDFLDDERRHDLITEGQYRAGREVERAFEREARVNSGGQWRDGDRSDAATAHEEAILAGMEVGAEVVAFIGWIRRTVGRANAAVLFRLLRDRWDYKQVAAERLMFGEKGQREISLRFRIALEILDEAKAAHGKEKRA